MKIYGPYKCGDGRKRIIVFNDDGSLTSKSWPRVLMERHLGRELLPTEHIDHKDENFENDDIDNLQILTLSENAIKHAKLHRTRPMYYFVCPQCKIETSRYENQVKANLKKGKGGPYCGRSCAGKGAYPESRKVNFGFVPYKAKSEN